jgi:CAAX protease family protein
VPFVSAAIWSISATLGLDLLVILTRSMRSADHFDVVSGVLCEAAAFLATLFFVIEVHEPSRALSDALALRPTRFSLCALAALMGMSSQIPFNRLAEVIEKRFPASAEDISAQAELFAAPTPFRKVMLVVAVGAIGPLVEELFFRGGLFRGIRRAHGAALSVVGVAVFFAAVHIGPVPLALVPVFLVGLILGDLRQASGSLWPSVILHSAFNTTAAVLSFLPDTDHGPATSLGVSLGCLVLTGSLLALYHAVASRAPVCKEARELDLT